MTRTGQRRLLLLAFALWICYTVAFSVIRMPANTQIDRWHLDLVFHFTSYLIMILLGMMLISWRALIPTLVIAGGTELIQARLPYRTASWTDFGVNLAGVAVGLVVWWLAAKRRRPRPDTKSGKR